MAHQIHIAFSKVTHGAGIVAGGPYFCAGDPPKSVVTAQTTCMKDPNRIDVDKLLFVRCTFVLHCMCIALHVYCIGCQCEWHQNNVSFL